MGDDEGVRGAVPQRLGEKLDDLSLAELDTRVALLRAEIVRLEAAKAAKQAAASAASSIFKT